MMTYFSGKRRKLDKILSVNNPALIWMSFILLMVCPNLIQAQSYDLLIKNGHIIDPGNNIDGLLDIAVVNGKIAKIGPKISEKSSKKVVDAKGMYVVPGMIDIHTHVFVGADPGTFADGSLSVSPDDFTLRSGVTTVVDAGTAGWRNFPVFKSQVIDHSKTRILAFINIFGSGMIGSPQEQDTLNISEQMTYEILQKYKDIIVGTCIGHYKYPSSMPFEAAESVAKKADLPLLVECHLPELSLKQQLERMRAGDIMTHAYEEISERDHFVGPDGKVRSEVMEAKKRGILFDLGHGGAGFWFSQAIPAMKQGLVIHSFGTDLHRFSINAGMKDFMNVTSKFLALGMSLNEVVRRATWFPAQSIKRPDLGSLSVGNTADITVFSIRAGDFGFVDAGGNRIRGDQKMQAELTLRAGNIVWDLNGISAREFKY